MTSEEDDVRSVIVQLKTSRLGTTKDYVPHQPAEANILPPLPTYTNEPRKRKRESESDTLDSESTSSRYSQATTVEKATLVTTNFNVRADMDVEGKP